MGRQLPQEIFHIDMAYCPNCRFVQSACAVFGQRFVVPLGSGKE